MSTKAPLKQGLHHKRFWSAAVLPLQTQQVLTANRPGGQFLPVYQQQSRLNYTKSNYLAPIGHLPQKATPSTQGGNQIAETQKHVTNGKDGGK